MEEAAESKSRSAIKLLALVGGAIVCFAAVAVFGWYQFAHQARAPIEIVKEHGIPGGGQTIEEGIDDFIRAKGVRLSEEFESRWGAEETRKDVFIVSYVFERGREADWISWEIDVGSGDVAPRDDWARQLWEGGN